MLNAVVKVFFPYKIVAEVTPFGNGHINNTYLVRLHGEKPAYILQRINTNVFPDPQEIVETHARLEDVVFQGNNNLTIARLIRTASGQKLHIDEDRNVWRLTTFIPDSYSMDIIEDNHYALEAGNAFGWFARSCHKLNPKSFTEAIPNFHSLHYRVKLLKKAAAHNLTGRLSHVESLLAFYFDYQSTLNDIEPCIKDGLIPLRIVHNDTKLNNLLFRDKKAVAVIDLDTVGPGILFYDYGDAVRTCANSAKEDEQDLSKVNFDLEAFEALTIGYIEQVKTITTATEEKLFYKAPFLMTYIMGIRFLTDFLNGDIYYKTSYPDHNLKRSLVQKTLIDKMEKNQSKMKEVILNALKALPLTR